MRKTQTKSQEKRAGIAAAAALAAAMAAFSLFACSGAPKVEVPSEQAQSDIELAADDMAYDFMQSPYTDEADYSLEGVEIKESSVAEDGSNVFTGTATFSNGSFRVSADVQATYAKDGDAWTPNVTITPTETRAIAGITRDPNGAWEQAKSIDFDEEAQTCTVTVDYEPQWFESVEGDVKYAYRFDGAQWVSDGIDASSATVSYQPLVGVYDEFETNSDEGGALVKIDITSIDDATGAITADVEWTRGAHGNGASMRMLQETIDDTDVRVSATLTGTVVAAPDELGNHRATATLTGKSADGYTMVVGIMAGSMDTTPMLYDGELAYSANLYNAEEGYSVSDSIKR